MSTWRGGLKRVRGEGVSKPRLRPMGRVLCSSGACGWGMGEQAKGTVPEFQGSGGVKGGAGALHPRGCFIEIFKYRNVEA